MIPSLPVIGREGFCIYNPYIILFLKECNPIGSVILYIVPLQ